MASCLFLEPKVKMQLASAKFWTLVTYSSFYDDNCDDDNLGHFFDEKLLLFCMAVSEF